MMRIKKINEYRNINKWISYTNLVLMFGSLIGFLFTKDLTYAIAFLICLINIYYISNEENFLTLYDRINKEDGVEEE